MNNINITNTKSQTIKDFFRKYTYLIIIGVAIVSFVLALVLQPSDETLNVGKKEISFILPMSNATVHKDYSGELQYNETLKQWEIHRAIDFMPGSSNEVVAVYEGTVVNVYSNYLEGTVVVIEHKDGLKTIYKSLDKTPNVKKDDVVKQGDVIGTVSTSMSREASIGAHLHFETWLQNKAINPNVYFTIENK